MDVLGIVIWLLMLVLLVGGASSSNYTDFETVDVAETIMPIIGSNLHQLPEHRSSISVAKLTELCTNFAPMKLFSTGAKELPLNVNVAFLPERLVLVQEVDQTVSMVGTLRTSWQSQCDGSLNGSVFAFGDDTLLRKLWHIPIRHVNVADYSTRSTFSSKSQHRTVKIQSLDRQFHFEQDVNGVFSSICGDFDFRNFPFDSHQCSFTFEVNLPPHVGNVGTPIQTLQLTSENCQWFVSMDSVGNYSNRTVLKWRVDSSTGAQQFSFSFTLARQATFLLYNLLLPLLLVTILQIFGLILPPSDYGRPVYAVGLLLGALWLRSEIFKETPPTSVRLFFHDYVMAETLIGVFCTLQSVIVCRAYNASKYSLDNDCCSVKFVKIPDIISFILGSCALVAIHCYFYVNYAYNNHRSAFYSW